MSKFYKSSDNVILNLDNVLYVRKTEGLSDMKNLKKTKPCVEIVYGANNLEIRYMFDAERERDNWFDEFAKDVGAIL